MVTRRPHFVRLPSLAALLLLTLSSCQVPNFEGPQIQEPPSRFLLQNDSWQNRRMFDDLEVTHHSAWIEAANGPYSGIYINAHQGVLGFEQVLDAQEAAKRAAAHPATSFGEIEQLTIDGRPAWGWAERLETPELGLDWVAYRAVVAYDTVSYAIEFYGGDPLIKVNAPDTLKTVIASFAVGETTWNVPLLALLTGVLLLGIAGMRNRAREKAARLQSINLVKIGDKPDAEAEAAPPMAAAGASRPPAPPAAPTELRHGK